MRAVLLLALFGLVAPGAEAARVSRIVPKDFSLRLERPQARVEDLARVAESPNPTPAFGGLSKGSAVLNCENDGVLDPANTLVLDVGDLAGTIFPVPNDPSPYMVAEIDISMLDLNSSYPAQLDLIILESNETGTTFDTIAGFNVDLDAAVSAEGEMLNLDLREFNVTGQYELLVLYGDSAGETASLILPVGDSTARCAPEDIVEVCSVHLPANEGTLFIYGAVDAVTCFRSTHNIRFFDIVMEVLLEDIGVGTLDSSFGALKARY